MSLAILNAHRLQSDSGTNVPTGEQDHSVSAAPTQFEAVQTFLHHEYGDLGTLFGASNIYSNVPTPDPTLESSVDGNTTTNQMGNAAEIVAANNPQAEAVPQVTPDPLPPVSGPSGATSWTFSDTLKAEVTGLQSKINSWLGGGRVG